LSVSFLLHCAPYVFLDTSKYNFYDTDTWYSVRRIDRLTHGETLEYDPILNYPTGRSIDWRPFPSVLESIFVRDTDTPLDIFNNVGFLTPIIAALFAISVYFLVGKLFSETAGFYTSIFVMFSGGNLFFNSLFGVIDHHLLSIFMCTTMILCLLISIKYKADRYFIPAIIAGTILYFTATLFLFYVVITASIIGILILHYIWITYKEIRVFLIILILILGAILFTQFIDPKWIYLLVSYIEPVQEMNAINPFAFLLITNVMLFILVVGYYEMMTQKKYDTLPISLFIITVGLAALTFKFQRIEYIFSPFAAIISGYFLDKHISQINAKKLMFVFIAISIFISVSTMGFIIQTSNNNQKWGDALQFLKDQDTGIVLTWWDYGHWIVAVSGQPPYATPFQNGIPDVAIIFTNPSSESTSLLKKNNISYILVTEPDQQYYSMMQWYAKSTVPYEQSYLKELIDGTAQNGIIIYDKEGLKIYDV